MPKNAYWTSKHYTEPLDKALHLYRKGYHGWMGYGGSIFQWEPELQIGFGYVPLDLFPLDFMNTKGSTIQKAMREAVLNLKE